MFLSIGFECLPVFQFHSCIFSCMSMYDMFIIYLKAWVPPVVIFTFLGWDSTDTPKTWGKLFGALLGCWKFPCCHRGAVVGAPSRISCSLTSRPWKMDDYGWLKRSFPFGKGLFSGVLFVKLPEIHQKCLEWTQPFIAPFLGESLPNRWSWSRTLTHEASMAGWDRARVVQLAGTTQLMWG